MAEPRDAYTDTLRDALEAMRHTREQLRAAEVTYRRAIRALDEGHQVGDILDLVAAAATRTNLNEALRNLELSRHRARLATFVLGQAEGVSLSELGRKIGVSRQLASRYAEEGRL